MRSIALASLFFLAACSASSDLAAPAPPHTPPTTGADAGGAGEKVPPTTIAWTPCDLDGRKKGTGGAECATVEVPRDYARPDGPKATLGVKRVARDASPRAQLWLVDGGPGGSVVNGFTTLARKVLTLKPDVAVYGVDHRGVGGSEPLECPNEESAASAGGATITDAEWPSCIAELKARHAESLPHMTTSHSMRDLATLVDRLRVPGVKVIVYGGSYGSYAVLRYMKLFPQQADAIVLEGIAPPGRNFDAYDAEMNEAARRLFDVCKSSATCSARLGPDPWATAGSVVASFGQGHCPALHLDTDGARALLGSFLFFNPIRDYLPILAYRMKRCEPRDVAAIAKFYRTTTGGASVDPPGLAFNDGRRDTPALFLHVALSELWHWDGLPDPNRVLARWREGTMSTGLTVKLAWRQGAWPIYARGPEVDAELPPFDRPMLMLQGTLDAATTVEPARRLARAYRGAHQTWAEFPTGSHLIVEGTPTKSGSDCGRQMLFQFLDDPSATLDTSCLSELAPIDFDGAPAVNQIVLGTRDGWDG